jgi:thiol-disulfide isomerase/thioredoxin
MKTNILIFIIIAGLTYGATLYFEHRRPQIKTAPQSPIENTIENAAAPDFKFKDSAGNTHSLNGLKGQNILLNFWASWCPPCIKELPLLLRAAKEENVVLIAVSSDIDEESMYKFLKKQNIDIDAKSVFFTWDENQEITQKTFQTFKLPETILIDDKGIMRKKIIGADWEYEDLIKELNAIKAAAE